jgi:hypothetical protein
MTLCSRKRLNIYYAITLCSKVKGLSLRKLKNRMLIYLNDELTAWLDEKAQQGYKKATLVRKVLDDYRKAEVMRNGSQN